MTPGRDFGSTMEILGGLQPGQPVIANPPDSLTDGEKVRVVSRGNPNQAAGAAHEGSRPRGGCDSLAAVALAGCMVGPNYKAPPVPAPPAY